MAPTCFGLRPSSRSLQLSLAKVILILKHSVRLLRNLLCGSVAACHNMACVLCAVPPDLVSLCTAHNTHAILGHAATQPHNKLRLHNTHAIPGHAATPLHNKLRRNPIECLNINITLARLNCKLPDDGRRPKHVGAISF